MRGDKGIKTPEEEFGELFHECVTRSIHLDEGRVDSDEFIKCMSGSEIGRAWLDKYVSEGFTGLFRDCAKRSWDGVGVIIFGDAGFEETNRPLFNELEFRFCLEQRKGELDELISRLEDFVREMSALVDDMLEDGDWEDWVLCCGE